VLERLVDRREEHQVQAVSRRSDVLEVREHAAGLEQVEDLAVQRPLALVLEVVDGHGRDDDVEAPELGQRCRQVVLDELDALVAGEAVAGRIEHELGEVQAHPVHAGTTGLQEGEQPTVARAEVEENPAVCKDCNRVLAARQIPSRHACDPRRRRHGRR